jgi:polysaccharide biosynthesis transport protein
MTDSKHRIPTSVLPVQDRPEGFGFDGAGPPELSVLDLLRILRRRWLLIATAMVIGGMLGAYRGYSTPPSYSAAAVIRLQDNQKTLTGMSDQSQPNIGNRLDALQSLLQVMRSEVVLGDAVDRSSLRLRDLASAAPPSFLDDVEAEPTATRDTLLFTFSDSGFTVVHQGNRTDGRYGESMDLQFVRFAVPAHPGLRSATVAFLSRDAVLQSVRGGLLTRQRSATDVVDVQFTAGNPVLAQRVLNEVVEAFQRNSVRMSQQQARMRRAFLEDQLLQAESGQQSAQLALSRFRSNAQLYSSATRMTAEQHGLMGVDLRREELLAERHTYSTVLRELERYGTATDRWISTLLGASTITSNTLFSTMLQQLIRYETQRQELVTGETGLRTEHPDVVRLDSLIAGTQERMLAAARSQFDVLDARLSQLNQVEEHRVEQMRRLPEREAEEVRLIQRVDGARRLSQTLEEELQRARIAEAVETGQVEILELAQVPRAISGKPKHLVVLFGIMIGLILGSGSAFAIEKLNTSVKHQDELEMLIQIPGLGVIPRISSAHSATGMSHKLRRILPGNERHVAAFLPLDGSGRSTIRDMGAIHGSPEAEAYRALRTSLTYSPALSSLKVLTITSATPREGKTTTAANLALAYAHQGANVLLLDADMRRPRQHQLFRVPATPGLADILTGRAAPVEAIRVTPVKGLSVLPAGSGAANAADLLSGNRMKQLLAACVKRFDLILIDTPPILAVADAAILAVQSEGTIIVVHAGRTDRKAVQHAVQGLTSVGANVIGAVLNDPDGTVSKYAPYSTYGYYYDAVK